jgi:hypothetical protein
VWSETSLVVSVPADLSGQDLPVIVTVGGVPSNTARTNVLGPGDVQITLIWHDLNDLDLRVTDPFGNILNFERRTSPTGGRLDVDANALCELHVSSEPRENVFWPAGRAPRGTYTVRAENFFSCNDPRAPSPFSVMIKVDGQTSELMSGTLDAGQRAEKTFTR